MDKVSTDVKYVEIDGKHLIAQLELVNANEDQFEIALNSPYAEGSVFDNTVAISVFVDVIDKSNEDYNLARERFLEILIEMQEEVDFESIESLKLEEN